MEEKGLIGPVDGAKPRKVYIDRLAMGADESSEEEERMAA
jgi:hypothetical protein